MTSLTPAQQKAIQNWTEQRDSLLREIGLYTTERDTRKQEANGEALRLTDLHTSIAEARGRIAELDALEERKRTSVATDVAELEVRKSRLEGECAVKEAELRGLGDKQVLLISSIAGLNAAHEMMKDQAVIVNKVVGDLIEISTTHLSDAKTLMIEVKAIADAVIEKGNENVKTTNIVLDALPKYVFELQKPIPIRRVFAPTPGMDLPAGYEIPEDLKNT